MTAGPTEPKWSKLLSLTAHELRSPLTVVGGYIRMLLKDQAGPLTDRQRRMLEEAEKSWVRLTTIVAEISELSQLESGTARFNRARVDLGAVLSETIAALPDLGDRQVTVELVTDPGLEAIIHGDPVRLRSALGFILTALRRELVTSDHLSVRLQQAADDRGRPSYRITVAEGERIDGIAALPPRELDAFDEWRGGNGLGLATARRIVEAHGGSVWSPVQGGKTGAIVLLPSHGSH
jgi:signal transduction histidine kinase